MPADASIYGQQAPVKINTPFENLSQVLQIRAQQQQVQSNQALEQERRQKLADDAAYRQAIQASAGMSPEDFLGYVKQHAPAHAPAVEKAISDASEKAATARKATADAESAHAQAARHTQDFIGHAFDQIAQSNGDPVVTNAVFNGIAQAFPEWTPHIAELRQIAATQGKDAMLEKAKAYVSPDIAKQRADTAALTAPPKTVQPGEGVRNAQGGYDVPLPKPAPAPTAASMDARFQELFKRQALRQPLTADERAEMSAYQARKLIGPEAAAANAANQQARAIAAQTASQQRTQNFAEQQAGRKELQEKVEAPYLTALSSAQTLKDTVASAQAGNKIGASLQALETTMAAVRAQGLNRVNMAEIGLPAGAGSAWDRIQGWFGKATQGQPVPANVQKDMLAFADILEKGAQQKYLSGWQATTKRYGLADEKPLVSAPAAGAKPPANETPEQRIQRLLGGG